MDYVKCKEFISVYRNANYYVRKGMDEVRRMAGLSYHDIELMVKNVEAPDHSARRVCPVLLNAFHSIVGELAYEAGTHELSEVQVAALRSLFPLYRIWWNGEWEYPFQDHGEVEYAYLANGILCVEFKEIAHTVYFHLHATVSKYRTAEIERR